MKLRVELFTIAVGSMGGRMGLGGLGNKGVSLNWCSCRVVRIHFAFVRRISEVTTCEEGMVRF